MENGTLLYFSMFENMGELRFLFFSLGFIVYFLIVFFNVAIILIIVLETALHQPMYILISCLSLNSLYGTAGLFPRLLTDLLSYTHTISRHACHVQAFVIYTYASNEYTILTLMAYDRFVAISKPLQYHSIITPKNLAVMIALAWICPMFSVSIGFILTARLKLCGHDLTKLYCSNWVIVRLSCTDTSLNNIFGFVVLITTVFIPLSFILFSYVKILIICQRNSSEFRRKAYHTCLPHIVTIVNYSITILCEITFSRYEDGFFPQAIAVILSLEFLTIPPLLNPLVYGLKFPDIHRKIQHILKTSKRIYSS
ncbi:putative gustatory receptor clone PTE03 [Colossoma macropomum]|uniref:putative gustatory receptor clone PTE03 n=1 Tax=Colossoma macropomum TaxID=42526 RepID=UPI0018642E85|nr:putative gustatory receptor clone PTE03 [Colossoma macropomum]